LFQLPGKTTYFREPSSSNRTLSNLERRKPKAGRHYHPGMASRRNLAFAGALVALVGLVALASRAHAPAGGGGGTQHLNGKLIWEYLLLGIFGLFIVCLPITAWVFWSSRGDRRLRKRRPKTYGRSLFVLLILALAAAVTADRLWEDHGHLPHKLLQLTGLATSRHTPGAKPGRPVPFDWLPAIVILAVATLGALVVTVILFRRPGHRKPTNAELAAQLSAVLDDSLDDLLAERDARRAVIATYARMERTLAGAGLPRAAAEAPLEYLRRVLRDLLHTSAEAVAKLTALFERAKFSHHEIDTTMKDDAIDALVSVRDELRAVAS
jgi:hypothetical protein